MKIKKIENENLSDESWLKPTQKTQMLVDGGNNSDENFAPNYTALPLRINHVFKWVAIFLNTGGVLTWQPGFPH